MPSKTYTLLDADGVSHDYETTLHPASQGAAIMWQLLALAAAPLGAAVKGFLATSSGFDLRAVLDAPDGLQRLGASVDFAAVGEDVGRALASGDRDVLVKQILSRTTRDGKRLDNVIEFDGAYTGNYGELIRVIWEAVRANRFLSLLGT